MLEERLGMRSDEVGTLEAANAMWQQAKKFGWIAQIQPNILKSKAFNLTAHLVRVITKVVTDMMVPSSDKPSDKPGGMLHDERA